jgi:hypothetical protein
MGASAKAEHVDVDLIANHQGLDIAHPTVREHLQINTGSCAYGRA